MCSTQPDQLVKIEKSWIQFQGGFTASDVSRKENFLSTWKKNLKLHRVIQLKLLSSGLATRCINKEITIGLDIHCEGRSKEVRYRFDVAK
jgi:hypothetical protein